MKDVARIFDFSSFEVNFCWKSLLGLLSRSRHVTNKIIQDILTVFTLKTSSEKIFFGIFNSLWPTSMCQSILVWDFRPKKSLLPDNCQVWRLKTWNAVLIMLKFSLLHHHVSSLDWNNDDSTCLPLWKLAQDCNLNKTGFYILVNSHLA